MGDRDRLIELLKQANTLYLDYLESINQKGLTDTEGRAKYIADYLIANGVICPPCKFLQSEVLKSDNPSNPLKMGADYSVPLATTGLKEQEK